VIAAGGTADRARVAAALMLVVQGINIGTGFLASAEAPITEEWEKALIAAAQTRR
jgi:NAD(P)H-dependent flavin oxidoreductase YrpB (nitropropane dioxygenase family)